MKLNRKWLMVIALVMSLTMATAGTLAYLTDRDTKVNTFTMGNVDIEVDEEYEQDSPLNPGVEVDKKAGVKNTHLTNSAWVWMTVSVPTNLKDYIELTWLSNDVKAEAEAEQNVVTNVHDGYTSYVVKYAKELAPGASTPQYLQGVTLSSKVDYQNGEYVAIVDGKPVSIGELSTVDIIVDGFAIQTEGFDSVGEAYAAYVDQWETLGNGGVNNGTGGDEDDTNNPPESGTYVTNVKELQAAMTIDGNQIKLGANITFTASDEKQFGYAFLANGKKVSIDLNGFNITYDKADTQEDKGLFAIANGGGIDIVGNGNIVVSENDSSHDTRAFFVMNDDCYLNIYGGTYSTTASNQQIVYSQAASTINIYGGSFVTNGESHGFNVKDISVTAPVIVLHDGVLLSESEYYSGSDASRIQLANGCALAETQINSTTWYKVVKQ